PARAPPRPARTSAPAAGGGSRTGSRSAASTGWTPPHLVGRSLAKRGGGAGGDPPPVPPACPRARGPAEGQRRPELRPRPLGEREGLLPTWWGGPSRSEGEGSLIRLRVVAIAALAVLAGCGGVAVQP